MAWGLNQGRQAYLELARDEGEDHVDRAVTALLTNVPEERRWLLLSDMARIVPPQPGSVLAQVLSAERDLAAQPYADTDGDLSGSDSDSDSDGALAFIDAR